MNYQAPPSIDEAIVLTARAMTAQATHLFVLIHGLYGGPGDVAYLKSQLLESVPDCCVFIPESNNYFLATNDGVDVGGDRIAREVLGYIEDLPWLR